MKFGNWVLTSPTLNHDYSNNKRKVPKLACKPYNSAITNKESKLAILRKLQLVVLLDDSKWLSHQFRKLSLIHAILSCFLWGTLLDYSKAWIIDNQPCGTCGTPPLGLNEFASIQILWICPLRVFLNLLARALVTSPIRTWIGSAFYLLVVPPIKSNYYYFF